MILYIVESVSSSKIPSVKSKSPRSGNASRKSNSKNSSIELPNNNKESLKDTNEKLLSECRPKLNIPVSHERVSSSKPPRSNKIVKKNHQISENSKKTKDTSLFDMNENSFNLLENDDSDAIFASSLSSSSSHLDYDNMALEAMAEADKMEEQTEDKQDNKLHNYAKPNQNLEFDVIEEDIENEIDSEYSVTIKRGTNDQLINEMLMTIRDSKFLNSLDETL